MQLSYSFIEFLFLNAFISTNLPSIQTPHPLHIYHIFSLTCPQLGNSGLKKWWVKHTWILFTLQDVKLYTGVISCRFLWRFYELFGLSFWWHPFTAEDPLVSKWPNPKFLQICSDEQTNSSWRKCMSNYDFMCIFMCIQLVNTIFPWLEHTESFNTVSTVEWKDCLKTFNRDVKH